jgi:hypothetical protein
MKLTGKVTRQINTGVLNKQAGKILSDYAAKLDPILDEQFKAKKWEWTDRITIRRNGALAGNPRDIIDTGELLASKEGPKSGRPLARTTTSYSVDTGMKNRGTTTKTRDSGVRRYWIWNSPYADAVKNGTGSGHKPRDWVEAALRELPFKPFVSAALSRLRTRKPRRRRR